MPFTDAEQHVRDVIAEREAALVELASVLIGFDTTARTPGEPAREEAPLQEYLAERLRGVGAEIDLFEADADDMRGRPLVPAGLDFAGRPQLIARLPASASGGRSLIFNGHIDVVSGEPKDRWTSDPFTAEVRDGRLYGRGACDMKGGVAAMTFAAETLAGLGIRLAGDLTVATNTDEESSGAGGMALVRRGLKADAAIVTEPTNHTTWVACRGSEYGTITVPGRPGHAEVRQPDWRRGGAVNAIEKAIPVLQAMRALREDWATREGLDHPHVSRPDLLATMARSGEWAVTYPASCDLTIAVMYVMAQADERGWGSKVREEVEARILEATRADEWLAENPPVVRWWDNPVMPFDIDPHLPVVTTMLETTADAGGPAELSGLDSWYDGATLTVFGGFPAIGYGPPGFDQDGTSLAHIIDEYVPVAGLVRCAQDLAVAAMRYCGLAE